MPTTNKRTTRSTMGKRGRSTGGARASRGRSTGGSTRTTAKKKKSTKKKTTRGHGRQRWGNKYGSGLLKTGTAG